jgi:hypothetical protein
MSAEELPLVNPAEPTASDTRPEGLTLAAVSRDGRRMLFVDAQGREFSVEVDERLRAALPADSPRRTEKPVTTPLRPRDIQQRIRGGESVDDVAAAAGTTVDKIMPFAAPVIAEREHMVERAQKGSVRRRAGEPAGAVRTLGDAVAQRLSQFYLDPDVIAWDSWRRPDGRWALLASYTMPDRSGIAELSYDTAGNYVALENDDARWLVGDQVATPEPVRDDLREARQRRSTPADQPLIADEPLEAFLDLPETVADAPEERVTEPVVERTVETPVEQPVAEEAPAPPEAAPEQPRKTSTRRKRASVPSWDEIMFGGGKGD